MEEFKLPEKWCLKVNARNYEAFKHVRDLGSVNKGYISSEAYTISLSWGRWLPDKFSLNGYVELTLDQFKKYVLKEDVIPEYFECIKSDNNYAIIGRIYKFDRISGPHYALKCNLKCDYYEAGGLLYFDKDQVKPSTKEAYETQNKPESLVGRYLKALVDFPQKTEFKKGEYVKILRFYYDAIKYPNNYLIDSNYCYTTDNHTANQWELMPEGFNPNNLITGTAGDGSFETKNHSSKIFENPLTDDELLEEAKRRYPIGTKYWNLDLAGNKSCPHSTIESLPIICKDVTFEFGDTLSKDGKKVILVKGNNFTKGWVYSNGKWADIVQEENKTDKSQITIKEVIKPTINVEYQLNNSITEIKLGLPVKEVKKVQPIKINLVNIKI